MRGTKFGYGNALQIPWKIQGIFHFVRERSAPLRTAFGATPRLLRLQSGPTIGAQIRADRLLQSADASADATVSRRICRCYSQPTDLQIRSLCIRMRSPRGQLPLRENWVLISAPGYAGRRSDQHRAEASLPRALIRILPSFRRPSPPAALSKSIFYLIDRIGHPFARTPNSVN